MNLGQIKKQIQANAILGALLSDGSITVVYKQPITDEALLFRTWEVEVLIVDEDYTDQVRSALDSLGFELVQTGSRIAGTKDEAITTAERDQINAAAAAEMKARQQAKVAAKEQATDGTLSDLQAQINELKEDIDLMGLVRPTGAAGPRGPAGAPGRDGRDVVATDARLGDLQDVTSDEPRQGQIVMWQEASQSWELRYPPQAPQAVPAGGGGGGGSGGGGGGDNGGGGDGGGGIALTVQSRDRENLEAPPTNAVTNVSAISFDTDSGFVVEDLGDGTQEAFIKLNSTFNPWHVDGEETLDATGEEPVEFVAGDGISIRTDATKSPKQIIIEADGLIEVEGGTGEGGGDSGGGGGGQGLEEWSETAEGHLVPNGAGQNLGSPEQPVGALYNGATVYLNDKPLSFDDSGWLTFSGQRLVEEAPLDGGYYVRHMGVWVKGNPPSGFDPDVPIDGGNLDDGTAENGPEIYDGGDFEAGTSIGTGDYVLDSGDFDGSILGLQMQLDHKDVLIADLQQQMAQVLARVAALEA